jgi:hypothetical protein
VHLLKKQEKLCLLGFLILVGIFVQTFMIGKGLYEIESASDWSTYQRISEDNVNATVPQMVVNKNQDTHLFWKAEIDGLYQISHRIFFDDCSFSEIESVPVPQFVFDNYSGIFPDFIKFEVISDGRNKLHFVYFDNIKHIFEYWMWEKGNWQHKKTIQILSTSEYELWLDKKETLHLIYSKTYAVNSVATTDLFERQFVQNTWSNETQITSHPYSETTGYRILNLRSTTLANGNIALFYYLYSFGTSSIRYKITCTIYDGEWHKEKILYWEFAGFDAVYDDTGKLHVIWTDYKYLNLIHYQTFNGGEWSNVTEINFLPIPNPEGYGGFSEIKLTIQGTLLFLSYNPVKFLEPYGWLDWDLYIATSEDGVNWEKKPIFCGNDTSSYYHSVISTKAGTTMALAVEVTLLESPRNYGVYLGYYENYFTYKAFPVKYPIFFSIISLIPIIILMKKTRK